MEGNVDEIIRTALIQTVLLDPAQNAIMLQLDYGDCELSIPGVWEKRPESVIIEGTGTQKALEIAGATDWPDLLNRMVRVKSLDNRIIAIGHINNDNWLDIS